MKSNAAPVIALVFPLAGVVVGPIAVVAIFGARELAQVFQIGGVFSYLVLLIALLSAIGAGILAFFSARGTMSGAFAVAAVLLPWLVGVAGMQTSLRKVQLALDMVDPGMAATLMAVGAGEALLPRALGAGASVILLILTGAGLLIAALMTRGDEGGGIAGPIGWSGVSALAIASFALGTCVALSFDSSALEAVGSIASEDRSQLIGAALSGAASTTVMIRAGLIGAAAAVITGLFLKPRRAPFVAGAATLAAATFGVMLLERMSDRSLIGMAASLRPPWAAIKGFEPVEISDRDAHAPDGAVAQDGLHLPMHAPAIALSEDTRNEAVAAFAHFLQRERDTLRLALDNRAAGPALHALIAAATDAGISRLYLTGKAAPIAPELAAAMENAPRLSLIVPGLASVEAHLAASMKTDQPRFRGRLGAGDRLILEVEGSAPIALDLRSSSQQLDGDGAIAAIGVGNDASAKDLVRVLAVLRRSRLKVVLHPL